MSEPLPCRKGDESIPPPIVRGRLNVQLVEGKDRITILNGILYPMSDSQLEGLLISCFLPLS